MKVDGLPTTSGSRLVEPRSAPTIAPPPAHSWASVRWVTASLFVAMKMHPGFSRMHSVPYLKKRIGGKFTGLVERYWCDSVSMKYEHVGCSNAKLKALKTY